MKRDDDGKLSVRVADFGMTGIVGGTPLYMAPEVLKTSIPFLSDIYSLGISLLLSVVEIQLAFQLYLLPSNKITKRPILIFLSRK